MAAQATGAVEHRCALSSAWCGMALAIPFGLIVAASGLWAAELVGVDGAAARRCRRWRWSTSARVMAAPFWYGFVVLRGYYQARGDMHAPMKLNMFANGINVPLDLAMVPLGWLLGVWLELGALGAWLGITAQVVVLALLICGVFVRGRWASGGTLATRSDPAPRSSCCGAQDAPQRLDAVVAGGESSNCA